MPIRSAGVFIYYIYPGAFVNIPDESMQLLSPFRQLKIICAGVWHNVVLYLWTFILLSGGLKLCLTMVGWQSLENSGGVSVLSVRHESPLAQHLPLSSIIYRLDDVTLMKNIDDWNAYLLTDEGRSRPINGFCTALQSLEIDCCRIDDDQPFGRSRNTSVSCFRDFTLLDSVSRNRESSTKSGLFVDLDLMQILSRHRSIKCACQQHKY